MSVTVDPAVERRLVARARDGDAAAFEALVRCHGPYVFNLALRTLGDTQNAEDAAQDALVRAWRGLPGFRDDACFKTWLYRIVVNVCYDRLPRLRREMSFPDSQEVVDWVDDRQDAAATALASQTAEHVRECIDALPESYRMLITLRHLQELTYAEIAAVTGMPLGTVKVGIHRARKRLRKVLAEHVEQEARCETA